MAGDLGLGDVDSAVSAAVAASETGAPGFGLGGLSGTPGSLDAGAFAGAAGQSFGFGGAPGTGAPGATFGGAAGLGVGPAGEGDMGATVAAAEAASDAGLSSLEGTGAPGASASAGTGKGAGDTAAGTSASGTGKGASDDTGDVAAAPTSTDEGETVGGLNLGNLTLDSGPGTNFAGDTGVSGGGTGVNDPLGTGILGHGNSVLGPAGAEGGVQLADGTVVPEPTNTADPLGNRHDQLGQIGNLAQQEQDLLQQWGQIIPQNDPRWNEVVTFVQQQVWGQNQVQQWFPWLFGRQAVGTGGGIPIGGQGNSTGDAQ